MHDYDDGDDGVAFCGENRYLDERWIILMALGSNGTKEGVSEQVKLEGRQDDVVVGIQLLGALVYIRLLLAAILQQLLLMLLLLLVLSLLVQLLLRLWLLLSLLELRGCLLGHFLFFAGVVVAATEFLLLVSGNADKCGFGFFGLVVVVLVVDVTLLTQLMENWKSRDNI